MARDDHRAGPVVHQCHAFSHCPSSLRLHPPWQICVTPQQDCRTGHDARIICLYTGYGYHQDGYHLPKTSTCGHRHTSAKSSQGA